MGYKAMSQFEVVVSAVGFDTMCASFFLIQLVTSAGLFDFSQTLLP
jgi:hypothetical protein